MEELQEPTYCGAEQVRRDARIQSALLQHFAARWRREYLTSLREFYRPAGRSGQVIKVKDVVLVHDDCPWINWKMAVLESLVTGDDGFVRSANIRTKNGVTNRPVGKLFPLKVCDSRAIQMKCSEGDQRDHNTTEMSQSSDNQMTEERPRCRTVQCARNQLAEWVKIIRGPPEDVQECHNNDTHIHNCNSYT